MSVVLDVQSEVGTRPSSQRFTPGTETVVCLSTRQLRNDIFGLPTGWLGAVLLRSTLREPNTT